MPSKRQSDLLALLLERGQTPVQTLADALGSSLATIRRDLTELEALGRVERLHGAAQIATAARKEVAFSAREGVNLPAKRAIAATAASALTSGATIFLDASTTVLQLARHIATTDQPMRVFTNSLRVSQELALVSHVDLTLIGGRVRAENLSMVGPLAHAALQDLWIDQLFLGATAIDSSGTLTSVDPEEAAINAQMIARARETRVLADATKLGQRTTHKVAQIAQGQTLITDAPPPTALADTAASTGFAITQTSPPAAASSALTSKGAS